MKKLTLFLVIVSALVVNTFTVSFIRDLSQDTPIDGVVERIVGAGNNPDRCVMFDQIASRTIKGNVKTAPGKVYQFTVTASGSAVAYFQIYDQVNLPIHAAGLATPSFSYPIPAQATAGIPVIVDYTFANPFDVTASGIMFAISENLADYSSGSLSHRDFIVNICYY